jgi:serine protease Do
LLAEMAGETHGARFARIGFMLAAAVVLAHVVSAPSLAPEVPRMTAPVVHVRAVKGAHVSSLPWVGHYLPHTTQNAVGSGFVIECNFGRRCLIVTNHHVVEGADRVMVTVDDRDLPAMVIGRDPELDVALLQVSPGRPLTAARLGNSSRVRVGDFVVAVGNPFGLDHTVTSGIVSARLRVITEATKVPLLQTDASINPGNSGGPLYDLRGNVIGINTAIVAGANGIGFAVPIDFVRRALPQLIASGKVQRGFLGVRLDQVTPEVAMAMRLQPRVRGVLVASVTPNGPAEHAGLRAGDIITTWDGQSVDSSEALPMSIALSPPGTRIKVKILRAGLPLSLQVRMGRLP